MSNGNESINYQCQRADLPGQEAGETYRFGRTVYLYPVFFNSDPEDQVDTIIHELGRLIPRITGPTGTATNEDLTGTNNVRNWTRYIIILSQDYDLIRRGGLE